MEPYPAPFINVLEKLRLEHQIHIFASANCNSDGLIYFGEIRYIKNNYFKAQTLQDEDICKQFNALGLAANKIFSSPKQAIKECVIYCFKYIIEPKTEENDL